MNDISIIHTRLSVTVLAPESPNMTYLVNRKSIEIQKLPKGEHIFPSNWEKKEKHVLKIQSAMNKLDMKHSQLHPYTFYYLFWLWTTFLSSFLAFYWGWKKPKIFWRNSSTKHGNNNLLSSFSPRKKKKIFPQPKWKSVPLCCVWDIMLEQK